jgi:uncharacterized membrane protein (UPF0182 family)
MKLKIIGLYVLGLFCLGMYFLIHHSPSVNEFLIKADNFGIDLGFYFYTVVGLVKMTLLIAGIGIPVILSLILVWRGKS